MYRERAIGIVASNILGMYIFGNGSINTKLKLQKDF